MKRIKIIKNWIIQVSSKKFNQGHQNIIKLKKSNLILYKSF